MRFRDVPALAGKYTLAHIMERDDFSNRYATNQPIGIHELLYPLMQGYDSSSSGENSRGWLVTAARHTKKGR